MLENLARGGPGRGCTPLRNFLHFYVGCWPLVLIQGVSLREKYKTNKNLHRVCIFVKWAFKYKCKYTHKYKYKLNANTNTQTNKYKSEDEVPCRRLASNCKSTPSISPLPVSASGPHPLKSVQQLKLFAFGFLFFNRQSRAICYAPVKVRATT